jgi:hypothetical protein
MKILIVFFSRVNEAVRDLKANARPELVSLPDNMDSYDTIILGYPKMEYAI